jgi:hypothetical protein
MLVSSYFASGLSISTRQIPETSLERSISDWMRKLLQVNRLMERENLMCESLKSPPTSVLGLEAGECQEIMKFVLIPLKNVERSAQNTNSLGRMSGVLDRPWRNTYESFS